MIAPLSDSYRNAREAFLDAATASGARLASYPHPLRGLDGEDLAVDVAEIGPADAEDVVMVVSGTHGVEGYLGSALQRHHLGALDADRASGPAVVFVHALNPYGFSWVRRVNEDNVDLNRNFVDWSQPPPHNEAYMELADVIVPSSWSDEEQQRTLTILMEKLDEVGMDRLQHLISTGQYHDPTGVFYGGSGPTWSHDWLHEFVGDRFSRARRAAIIDLHTGLGPWGHGELISHHEPDTASFRRQREWWSDVTSMRDGTSVSADLSGDWLAAVDGFAPGTDITSVALEYGTVDVIAVIQSLRADAVLHAHGDPTAPEAASIRDQVRAAFADDDPAWLEKCWARYRSVVTVALERLTS